MKINIKILSKYINIINLLRMIFISCHAHGFQCSHVLHEIMKVITLKLAKPVYYS